VLNSNSPLFRICCCAYRAIGQEGCVGNEQVVDRKKTPVSITSFLQVNVERGGFTCGDDAEKNGLRNFGG